MAGGEVPVDQSQLLYCSQPNFPYRMLWYYDIIREITFALLTKRSVMRVGMEKENRFFTYSHAFGEKGLAMTVIIASTTLWVIAPTPSHLKLCRQRGQGAGAPLRQSGLALEKSASPALHYPTPQVPLAVFS